MNGKIWVSTTNADGVEFEHEWSSIEELQNDWCSEECICPCGDDEVLGYSINGIVQDTHNIKENNYGISYKFITQSGENHLITLSNKDLETYFNKKKKVN